MTTLNGPSGWVIDYMTAQTIFESGSNVRIDTCIKMCSEGSLHICHCEEKLFKGHTSLCGPFISDQNCIHYPDAEIRQQCINVADSPKAKKLLNGNQGAVVITALAACYQYGVISDHRSPVFNTVYDLCQHFGIPIYSADEFFALQ